MSLKNKLIAVLSTILYLYYISQCTIFASTYGSGSFGGGIYSTEEDETSDESCSKDTPNGEITITNISSGDEHLTINFEGAAEPFNKYEIKWGLKESLANDYIGDQDFGTDKSKEYVIENLNPETKYYVKIRALNGCKGGKWSDTMGANTLPVITTGIHLESKITDYDVFHNDENNNSQTDLKPSSTAPSLNNINTFTLIVKVVDEKNNKLSNATVHINPINRDITTDSEGVSLFNNLIAGQYEILVHYKSGNGIQTVNIKDSDIKQIEMTIQISEGDKNIFKPLTAVPIVLIAGGILFVLIRIRK